jgi:phosphate transport system substrate-binding protein
VSMRDGVCNNLGRCEAANSHKVISVPEAAEFRCPECGSELSESPSLAKARWPAPFVAFLVLQVLFLSWMAWRWKTGVPHNVLAKTRGNIVLRLAGSNTIGATLGPAMAQEFLRHLGATDVKVQRGANEEEQVVVATLPGQSLPWLITVAAHGSATAFTGLAANSCDIGMASRRIKPDEARSLSSMGDMTSPAAEHVLGLDGIAVIVNPANPVQSLSGDQIAKIFSGAIASWSEAGVQQDSIRVYARDNKSDTYDTFKSLVLGTTPLVATAKRFEDSNQLSDAVAGDPNGIGFIGLPYIHSAKAISVAAAGARALRPNLLTVATEDYPLSRRLYLYTSGNSPNKLARQFVEFALSKQGQDVVGSQGFVSQNIQPEKETVAQDAPAAYRRRTEGADRLSLDFRFRTGHSDLDNKALVDLDRMAAFFGDLKHRGDDILLFGFSDSTGSRSTNMQLSRARAKAIKDQFEQRGLEPAVVEGFGPDLPVASNDTDDGREKNRRVEVWLRHPTVASR